MCWSGEASLAMTAIGVGGALWSRKSGMPPAVWVSLLWFTGMEAIQAATYTVIGQCGDPLNTTLTYAGYSHIALQGFFVQWLALAFIGEKKRKKWFKPAMAIAGLQAFLYLAMAFAPPLLDRLCTHAWFCAEQTCSVHGNWHIAWQVRLSWAFEYVKLFYFFAAFVFPLFYGSWRWSLFHLITGPLAARMTTNNRFEIAAVWCLFSIGLLTAMKIPPLWRWLNTERLKEEASTVT